MDDRTLLTFAAKAAGKRERHGMNKSPEHRAWVHMRQRCSNQNRRDWPHYGGRGIKVCDAWAQSFLAFFADVGPKPSDRHSLDRINVDGHYEPSNVRWATQQQQVENTRVVRLVEINGRSQSISAWEREMGFPKGMVRSREASGWGLIEAILTPSVPGQKRHMRAKRDYSTRTRDDHGRYKPEAS
jgi:hypothetical protein